MFSHKKQENSEMIIRAGQIEIRITGLAAALIALGIASALGAYIVL